MLSPSLPLLLHSFLSNQQPSVQRGCDPTLLRSCAHQESFATQIRAVRISVSGTLHPPTRGRACVDARSSAHFLCISGIALLSTSIAVSISIRNFSLTFIHIMYVFTRPLNLTNTDALYAVNAFYHIDKRLVLMPPPPPLSLFFLPFSLIS